MKKILMTGAFAVTVSVAWGQNSLDPSRQMTAAEARAANGVVQPKYKGGKSYAQHVAEQRAMQKNITQNNSSTEGTLVVQATDRPVNNQPAPVNTLRGDETKEPAKLIGTQPVAVNQQQTDAVNVAPPRLTSDNTASNSTGVSPQVTTPVLNGPEGTGTVTQPKLETKVQTPPAQTVTLPLPAGAKLQGGADTQKVEPATESKNTGGSTDGEVKAKTN